MKFKWEGSALQLVAEAWFVLFYTLFRVLSLPVAVYGQTVLRWADSTRMLGTPLAATFAVTLWALVGLQLFWFERILAMIFCKKHPHGPREAKKAE